MHRHRSCGCSYWSIINVGGKNDEEDAKKDSNLPGMAGVVRHPLMADGRLPGDMFNGKYSLRNIPRYDNLEAVCQWAGFFRYDSLEGIPTEAGAWRPY